MRIEVDVKHKPEENDIIVFKRGQWVNMNVNEFLRRIDDLGKKVDNLNTKCEKLEKENRILRGEIWKIFK